ncbi:hypothetical protein I5H06_gp59 [Mycobacterium phage SirPhilip]|uniref:Uncharacterized protein n=1 Tax=Mycobacterium phage SirPhilip TaxID=2015824 RepID=A0A222ZLG5_9CAUD|nr:hypothetical protein I5H06_gp59 [Mycobacterium phage SirPhilip]ASR85245.1 hypothetical protein SEA_SIRPHILIP_43 [Mycobacterium phage SirPhilip]
MEAEIDKEPVETSVLKWRGAGRHYAKQAQEMILEIDEVVEDDERAARMVEVTATASLATMYFALANDADCFGKLPPAHSPDDE